MGGAAKIIYTMYFSEYDEGQELSSVALEQLATHIPDMVLYRSHLAPVPQITHCYGVIMFLDVSGTINVTYISNNVTV